MRKNKSKGLWVIITAVIVMLAVGAVGVLSQGFRNFDKFKPPQIEVPSEPIVPELPMDRLSDKSYDLINLFTPQEFINQQKCTCATFTSRCGHAIAGAGVGHELSFGSEPALLPGVMLLSCDIDKGIAIDVQQYNVSDYDVVNIAFCADRSSGIYCNFIFKLYQDDVVLHDDLINIEIDKSDEYTVFYRLTFNANSNGKAIDNLYVICDTVDCTGLYFFGNIDETLTYSYSFYTAECFGNRNSCFFEMHFTCVDCEKYSYICTVCKGVAPTIYDEVFVPLQNKFN